MTNINIVRRAAEFVGDRGAERVNAFANSLTEGEVAALALGILDDAQTLWDAIDQLPAAIDDGIDDDGEYSRALRIERDRLESARVVLAVAVERFPSVGELRASVEDALCALDESARAGLSLIDLASARSDARLEAVGWQEPEAWWGQ